MIKGKKFELIKNKSLIYKDIDALNQSMIKLFDSDPIKFFNEYKMGKARSEKINTSLIIGSIVDFYLLECDGDKSILESRLNEKFILFEGNKGSGQVFLLVDYLIEETKKCMDEKGEINCDFETRINDAIKRIQSEGKYRGKSVDVIIEDFVKNGKSYFEKCMESIDKTVVDISLLDKAIITGNTIKNDEFVSDIFNWDNTKEKINHLVIEFKYDVEGRKFINCKAEIDMLIIDHLNKTIQLIDLKTTYDNENFEVGYIKNKYYLQVSFYYLAVKEWIKNKNISEYKILPMKFVVGDTSSNNRRPLLYITSEEDVIRGLEGFCLKGEFHRGIKELIEDIVWAEDNNEWRCSKEAFNNNGRINLNINYNEK